jgi:hypothetical protein
MVSYHRRGGSGVTSSHVKIFFEESSIKKLDQLLKLKVGSSRLKAKSSKQECNACLNFSVKDFKPPDWPVRCAAERTIFTPLDVRNVAPLLCSKVTDYIPIQKPDKRNPETLLPGNGPFL